MGVRKLKAITPGQRFRSVNDYAAITATAPEKSLTAPKKRSGGRNNTGKMTMRYMGGGAKQRYRIVDFKREKFGIPATVKTIEYDPNRSAFIALVVYADGEKRYIIAPNGLQVDQTIVSGTGSAPEVGNSMKLSELPLGRSSTTSNYVQVRAASLRVVRVPLLNFLHVMGNTPR